jgi:hypothetical protein
MPTVFSIAGLDFDFEPPTSMFTIDSELESSKYLPSEQANLALLKTKFVNTIVGVELIDALVVDHDDRTSFGQPLVNRIKEAAQFLSSLKAQRGHDLLQAYQLIVGDRNASFPIKSGFSEGHVVRISLIGIIKHTMDALISNAIAANQLSLDDIQRINLYKTTIMRLMEGVQLATAAEDLATIIDRFVEHLQTVAIHCNEIIDDDTGAYTDTFKGNIKIFQRYIRVMSTGFQQASKVSAKEAHTLGTRIKGMTAEFFLC